MREARDTVAIALAATVALFVLSTLAVVFVLALRGVGLPDVWDALFGLVIAVMSALGGWMVGKRRDDPAAGTARPEAPTHRQETP